MKLFQIEEPDGSPTDVDGPGAAVGIDIAIDLGGAVAFALAGNAELLPGRDGERRLVVPGLIRDGRADEQALGGLLLGLRERAEKQLARPVSHAVIATDIDRARLDAAASRAGLVLLRVLDRAAATALAGRVNADDAPALGAALQAEDDGFALGAR
jgi:hypothetical protein